MGSSVETNIGKIVGGVLSVVPGRRTMIVRPACWRKWPIGTRVMRRRQEACLRIPAVFWNRRSGNWRKSRNNCPQCAPSRSGNSNGT